MKKFRLVNAATGTGKTIAYLAPIIHHLQSYDKRIERSDGTFGAYYFLFCFTNSLICSVVHHFQFHCFIALRISYQFLGFNGFIGNSVGSCTNARAMFAGS